MLWLGEKYQTIRGDGIEDFCDFSWEKLPEEKGIWDFIMGYGKEREFPRKMGFREFIFSNGCDSVSSSSIAEINRVDMKLL